MPFTVDLIGASAQNPQVSNPFADIMATKQGYNKTLLDQLATRSKIDFARSSDDPFMKMAAFDPKSATAIAYGRNSAVLRNMQLMKQDAMMKYQSSPSLENLKNLANVNGNTNLLAQLSGISTSGGIDASIMNSEILPTMEAGGNPYDAINQGIFKSQLNRTTQKVNAAGQVDEWSGPAGVNQAGAMRGGFVPGITNQGSISSVNSPVGNLMETISNVGITPTPMNNPAIITDEDEQIPLTEIQNNNISTAGTDPAAVAASAEDIRVQTMPRESQQVLESGPAAFETMGQPLDIAQATQKTKFEDGDKKKVAIDTAYSTNPDMLNILNQIGSTIRQGARTDKLQPIANQVTAYLNAIGDPITDAQAANLDLDKFSKQAQNASIIKAAGELGARGIDTPAESQRVAASGLNGSDPDSVTVRVMNNMYKDSFKQDMVKEYANLWEKKMGNLNAKSAKGQDFQEWFNGIWQNQVLGGKDGTVFDNPDYVNGMVNNNIPIPVTPDQYKKYLNNIPDGALVFGTKTRSYYEKVDGKLQKLNVQ